MPDMLVKLYELPQLQPFIDRIAAQGIHIRHPVAPEKHVVVGWVKNHFTPGWASEVKVCFSNMPVSCFIALKNKKIVGFSSYESTRKNFFGPLGVDPKQQRHGIGKALLLVALYALRDLGYAYAIIGFTGSPEFYEHFVCATPISGSEKSYFAGMLT